MLHDGSKCEKGTAVKMKYENLPQTRVERQEYLTKKIRRKSMMMMGVRGLETRKLIALYALMYIHECVCL